MCGLNAAPGGKAQAELTEVREVQIDHDQWQSFLENFSRYHSHWPVTIEQVTPTGKSLLAVDRRLNGVAIDDAGERARIQTRDTAEEDATYTVNNPTRICLKQTRAGAHVSLEFTSVDGNITSIRFRTAVPPEMLDGVAA